MKTATVTDFRKKMKELLNEVQDDQDVLMLTGPKKKDFVVLTLEMFNAMEETAYLLSTPANALWLMESIAQDKAGKVVVKELNLDKVDKGEKPKPASKKKSAAKHFTRK